MANLDLALPLQLPSLEVGRTRGDRARSGILYDRRHDPGARCGVVQHLGVIAFDGLDGHLAGRDRRGE